MANYLAFADIYQTIERLVTDFRDQNRRTELKALVNMVYLDEVMVCDDFFPLHWLMDLIDDVKAKDAATITGFVPATGVVTAASHGFVSGDIIQIDDVVGSVELNHRTFVVVYINTSTFTLTDLAGTAIVTTGYTAYTSGGEASHRGTTLAKALRQIKSFAWHGYNSKVEPILFDEIEKSTSWMNPENTSRPIRHLHKQFFSTAGTKTDRLLWFPLPNDNYEARIWGELDVAPMSDDAHVPQLPFRFHNTIVSGTIARLLNYPEIQIENAVIWPGLYKAQLESIKAYNRAWWEQFKEEKRNPFV